MSGYEIVAFAGSVNPEFQSIPFHPVSVILKQRDSESLRKLLHLESHGRTDLSELFQGDLIFCGIEAESKNDILDLLAEALHKTGCVTEDFHLSIYKRELFAPTLYQSAIAIPHGDPAYVTKPAIAVGLLKQPVLWDDENVTDLVFMIAFQETSMVYFEALYKLISQLEHLEILRKSSSVSEFLHCLNELTLLF